MLECIGARHQFVFAPMEDVGKASSLDPFADGIGYRFSVEAFEGWFVVESINLRGAADQENENDGFCARL